jgi:hypothetical protein
MCLRDGSDRSTQVEFRAASESPSALRCGHSWSHVLLIPMEISNGNSHTAYLHSVPLQGLHRGAYTSHSTQPMLQERHKRTVCREQRDTRRCTCSRTSALRCRHNSRYSSLLNKQRDRASRQRRVDHARARQDVLRAHAPRRRCTSMRGYCCDAMEAPMMPWHASGRRMPVVVYRLRCKHSVALRGHRAQPAT